MTGTTRRSFIGGAALGGALLLGPALGAGARQATPVDHAGVAPAYATARVRQLPTAALNQAIYPDVMARYLPAISALPGFHGYVFVFDDADPTTTFTVATMESEEAAQDSVDVVQDYVGQLDPRFVVETPLSAEGHVRMYATTDRASTELPPFLHGAAFTMRDQTTAPGVDIEAAVDIARETLIPLFLSLPGFILYCWLERPGGRVAINIWDTHEDLTAAGEALAAWREEHFATPTASEQVNYNGTIGYATIDGLT